MEFLKVDEVVQTALTIMPDADDRVAIAARQWAYMAQREIGVGWFNKKESEFIPIIDFVAYKPDDFLKSIDIAVYNENLQELKHYVQSGVRRIHPTGSATRSVIDVSEAAGQFNFATNATEAKWIKLIYYATPVDEEGLPLIPEPNLHATIQYILYMYAQRNKDADYKVAAQYDRWLQAAGQARGRQNTPSPLQAQWIAQNGLFNSMIKIGIEKAKYKY